MTYWVDLEGAGRPGMVRNSDGVWYAMRNIGYPDDLRPLSDACVRKLQNKPWMMSLAEDTYIINLVGYHDEQNALAEAERMRKAQLESEAELRLQKALAYRAEEQRLEAEAARKRKNRLKQTAIVGGAAAAGLAIGAAATRRTTCGDCSDTPYRHTCGDCSDTPRHSCDCDHSCDYTPSCDSSCDFSSCDYSGGGGDSSW